MHKGLADYMTVSRQWFRCSWVYWHHLLLHVLMSCTSKLACAVVP